MRLVFALVDLDDEDFDELARMLDVEPSVVRRWRAGTLRPDPMTAETAIRWIGGLS